MLVYVLRDILYSDPAPPQATDHETTFFAFFRVWGGGGNLLTSCILRELRGLGGIGGDVNVPVNLLTSCMLFELRGLGVVGGVTCSRHVCFVNLGVAWVLYIYMCVLHNEII